MTLIEIITGYMCNPMAITGVVFALIAVVFTAITIVKRPTKHTYGSFIAVMLVLFFLSALCYYFGHTYKLTWLNGILCTVLAYACYTCITEEID